MEQLDIQGIERVSSAQNLAFVLGDSALFFGTGYKVLQNQQKSYLVPCARSRFNGKIKLTYFTKELLPLGTFLLEADAASCQKAMVEFVRAIIDIRDNGFFSLQNILLGLDAVYVDAALGEPRIVYLPIMTSAPNHSDLQMIQRIYRFCVESMGKATNASASLSGLCDTQGYKSGDLGYLLEVFRHRESKDSQIQGAGSAKSNSAESLRNGVGTIYNLTSTGRHGAIVFQISQPQTVLGKSPSKADCVIKANSAVSREHCRLLLSRDGRLSVVDLSSSNGTYVNGVRLHPNKPVPLHDGSHLALADVEFVVVKAR